jgi:hypothetical protein
MVYPWMYGYTTTSSNMNVLACRNSGPVKFQSEIDRFTRPRQTGYEGT